MAIFTDGQILDLLAVYEKQLYESSGTTDWKLLGYSSKQGLKALWEIRNRVKLLAEQQDNHKTERSKAHGSKKDKKDRQEGGEESGKESSNQG